MRGFLLHFFVILLLFVNVYPLGMLIWGSLKDEMAFQYAPFIPTFPLDFSNYAVTFFWTYRYVINTLIVAAAGVLGNLFISSLSAYVFARMKFYGKEVLFYFIIALMMIPSSLSLVPTYMMYDSFGLFNSYLGLILPLITGGPIFGTFLLRSSFESIPEEVFEAARMDGTSEFQAYRRICLPMSMPIIGTLAIINVIGIWNDVIWPSLIIEDTNLLTVAAGLFTRFGGLTTNYPLQFSGFVITSVPLMFLFIFATRFYVEGMSSSGLKM